MRRLIVHIGMPKTGTTSIQSALSMNREELLRQGILYPRAGAISSGGHLNLAWQSLGDWKFRQVRGGWSDAAEEVRQSSVECVIISAETFGGYVDRVEVIRDISAFAAEIDAEPSIIGCARPQVPYMESVYAQSASTGFEYRKFGDFVSRSMRGGRFELETCFGRWFDAFRDVRLFEYASSREGGVLGRFLDAAGLGNLGLASCEPSLNPRVGIHAVEYVRYAANIMRSVDALDVADRHRAAAILKKMCGDRFLGDPVFVGFDEASMQKVEAHFSETNTKFARERLGVDGFLRSEAAASGRQRNAMDLDLCAPDERMQFVSMYTAALAKALKKSRTP